ncbi:class I SAM-dependent methyltransferase [Streptomyces sp. NPDC005963]|uniref:class I SAM-dependent methyltransferase n=1 Tax=Streptomyces sp. NPDC005963 TaxID=3156721 RepID=UPI0033DFB8FD
MTLLRDQDLAHAFDRAADSYDRLVAMNPGYHADLRRSARRLQLPDGGAGLRLLDLGCGTGASTAALLRAAPRAEITAVDASAGMLERAAAKSWPSRVTFVHASAEELALRETGGTGAYDAVFAAYLLRNVTDVDGVLASVQALLRPGGRLAVHEYSLSGRALHRALWTALCRTVIIPAGTLTGDRDLYHHLWHSVLAFDTAPELTARLVRGGWGGVRSVPMPGWSTGVVHTFIARRDALRPAGATA